MGFLKDKLSSSRLLTALTETTFERLIETGITDIKKRTVKKI